MEDFKSCHCGSKLYYSDDGVNVSKIHKKEILDETIHQRIADRKFKKVNKRPKNSFSLFLIAGVLLFGLILMFHPGILFTGFPFNVLIIAGLFTMFFFVFMMNAHSRW